VALTSVNNKYILVINTGINHRVSFDLNIKSSQRFSLNCLFKSILISIKSAAGDGNPAETPSFIKECAIHFQNQESKSKFGCFIYWHFISKYIFKTGGVSR
jgi:hypothetical protein